MYIFVTLAIRLMGKRQIGDMQPGELVITLLISEIAAIPLQDPTRPVLTGVAAIFTLVIFEILMSVAAMKSLHIRKLMSGKSTVIIRDGKVDEEAMKRVRMTVLDLIELLRQNDIFELNQVAYAVLEVNGNLSVLKKSQFETVTRKDMKIKPSKDGLALPVVCDGRIIEESLKTIDVDKDTLFKTLSEHKVMLDDVFILMLDGKGKTELVKKERKR